MQKEEFKIRFREAYLAKYGRNSSVWTELHIDARLPENKYAFDKDVQGTLFLFDSNFLVFCTTKAEWVKTVYSLIRQVHRAKSLDNLSPVGYHRKAVYTWFAENYRFDWNSWGTINYTDLQKKIGDDYTLIKRGILGL